MRKILATGGCGYIGSHTCTLQDGNCEVVIVDNLSNSKEVVDKIEKITGKVKF